MIRRVYRRYTGFSIFELIVAMGLFGILSAVAIINLKELDSPLVTSAANLGHYFRLARVQAIAQTKSILIQPESNKQLSAATASNCAAEEFTAIDDLDLELGDDVYLGSIDWSVCFTQRGQVDEAVTFTLNSNEGSRVVEIALGGGVQIQ